MTEEEKIEELYDRCLQLEMIRYCLEDKIQAILENLLHTHITIEEIEEIKKIIDKKEV